MRGIDRTSAVERAYFDPVLDHKLWDGRILAILAERERKGVAVEIYRGDPSDPLKPHGRLIIVDQQMAVFGSFSLSERSPGREA